MRSIGGLMRSHVVQRGPDKEPNYPSRKHSSVVEPMQADRLLLKNPLPRPLQMAVEKLLRTQVAQRLLNMRLQTLSRTAAVP